MTTPSLIQQIKDEAELIGITFSDGFELSDIVSLIEAVSKILSSSQSLWKTLDREERKKAVLDMVLALDDQYNFSTKISETFVDWDIPYLPDHIVDVILNKTTTKMLIRSFYSVLIESVFKRLDRKAITMGSRAWQPVSKQ